MLENILPCERSVPESFIKTLTLRLDKQTRDDLMMYARRDGFTASMLIRHLIFRYLDERKRISR